jgi:hypothetical protein
LDDLGTGTAQDWAGIQQVTSKVRFQFWKLEVKQFGLHYAELAHLLSSLRSDGLQTGQILACWDMFANFKTNIYGTSIFY